MAEGEVGVPQSSGIAGLAAGLHPAVRAIVLESLRRGVGQTLSTNVQFKREHDIGAGTMQRALELLRERGALRVVSRGHLGRVIEAIDVGQCWQAAGLPPASLLLPPSGPAESDVLDDRLAEEFTRLGIPHTVHHRPGGAGRLAAVVRGEHDLAVVSAGVLDAAVRASAGGEGGWGAVRRLDPGTYYGPGRLVVVRRAGDPAGSGSAGTRVAIDRSSPDHAALTVAEFPESAGHTHVDVPFTAVPAQVLRGRVDVGIWHIMRSVIPLDLAGLETVPLARPEARAVRDRLSGAALIVAGTRPELAAVLAELRLDDLARVQAAALAAESAEADALG